MHVQQRLLAEVKHLCMQCADETDKPDAYACSMNWAAVCVHAAVLKARKQEDSGISAVLNQSNSPAAAAAQ
jgi:hypothetical protein